MKTSMFGEDEPDEGTAGRKTYTEEAYKVDGPVTEDVYGLAGPLPAPPRAGFQIHRPVQGVLSPSTSPRGP